MSIDLEHRTVSSPRLMYSGIIKLSDIYTTLLTTRCGRRYVITDAG